MNHNLRDKKIAEFARNVLGCGCPDEVFNKIEVSLLNLGAEVSTVTRIVIGDTLLIYILSDTSDNKLSRYVGELAHAGKQDRDLHAYNRFRLVVPSCNDRVQERQVSDLYAAAIGDDEKLHIHHVDPDALDVVLQTCNLSMNL